MMRQWIRVTSFLALLLVTPWPAQAIQWGAGTGSSYPTTIDAVNNRTNVGGGACSSAVTTNICKEWLNDWQSAVIAIQTELGTLPKGTSASVKERLAGIRSLAGATADTLIVSGYNVGVGTTSPTAALHVYANGGDVQIKADSNTSDSYITLARAGANKWGLINDYEGTNYLTIYDYTRSDSVMVFKPNGNSYFKNGSVGIGTNVPPASGGPALAFGQGANPTGIGANTAGLYAKDVAGTAELFTFDEAGNFTQISAADSSILNRRPPNMIWMPWAFSKANIYTGEVWEVDMGEVIAAVETLTGKAFATHVHGSRQDWDANQQMQADAQQQAIETAKTAKAKAVTDAEAEIDEAIHKERRTAANAMTIPVPYTKKPIPQWIQRRIETAMPKTPAKAVR